MVRDSNITRLSSLVITPDENDRSNGLYPPILTNAQIAGIPSDEIQVGGIAFNSDTQELMTYTAALEWVNILTDGIEDVTITNLTVTTLTVTDTITTFGLEVTGEATILNLNVTGTASILNLSVTGDTNLADTIISGDLTVVGLSNLLDLRIGTFNNGGTLAGSTTVGGVSNITYVLGTAAGTAAVMTIQGSPVAGNIRLTAGSTPSGTTVCTFTLPNTAWKQFSSSYWAVSITPLNANAAGADAGGNVRAYISNISASDANTAATFVLSVDADTPLIEDEDYQWYYIIIGNSYVA